MYNSFWVCHGKYCDSGCRTLPSFLVIGVGSQYLPMRLSSYLSFTPSTMASRKSTKLRIPHSQDDCELVGILEQLAPEESTQGRKIALV
jgi:hypothetical protein